MRSFMHHPQRGVHCANWIAVQCSIVSHLSHCPLPLSFCLSISHSLVNTSQSSKLSRLIPLNNNSCWCLRTSDKSWSDCANELCHKLAQYKVQLSSELQLIKHKSGTERDREKEGEREREGGREREARACEGGLQLMLTFTWKKRQRGHTANYAVGGHGMASLPLYVYLSLSASILLPRSLSSRLLA